MAHVETDRPFAEHETHAEVGHGEHTEHHVAGVETLLWPSVNFLIYCALLCVIYKKSLRPALRARSIRVEQHLRRAGAEIVEAERLIHNLEEEFRNLDAEKKEIERQFIAEGEAIAVSLKRQAQEEVQQIELDAKRQAESALLQAERELRRELIAQVLKRVRLHYSSALSGDEDRRLREEALSTLNG